jgi:hypothetical protein
VGEFEFGVYQTAVGDYVSLLSADHVFRRGLPGEAIVGQLRRPLATGEAMTPDTFAANSVFRQYLHRFIAINAPLDPDMQAGARQQGDGFMYLIDQRTPTPGGDVPPEDIVGRFVVSNGQVKPETYEPNPQHRLLSEHGFFRLGEWLEARLISELEQLPTG